MRMLTFIICIAFAMSAFAAEYTVKPGETLSKIAQQQLGDKDRWKEIAELNGIKDPFTVKSGQKILMPEVFDDEHVSPEEIIQTPLPDGHDSPEEIIQTSLPDDEHETVEEIINAPEKSAGDEIDYDWLSITVLLLLSWVFWSIGFKAGCWFSLVEVSWKKCFIFPFIMMLGLLALGLCAKFLAGLELDTAGQALSTLVAFYVAAMLITILFMKKYLDCKWRSVFTVWIMTSVLANVLVILTLYGLSASVNSFGFVRQLIDSF